MAIFSYYKTSKTQKIRYLKITKKNKTYLVFLHGFMSDLEGEKPKNFLNFSKKHDLGFLALEYSGHGKSSGKFINGNISKWSEQTHLLIKKIVKKNNFILIGSSMGAWISINQFKIFKNQIKGFCVGLDRLFLSVLSRSYDEETLEDGSQRTVLHLPAPLAPIKAAILPLVKKDGMPELARKIQKELSIHFNL